MLISGLIAGNLGWEAVFYIEGGLAMIWLVFWVICSADTPQQARFISQEERDYITTSLNQGGEEEGSSHKV